MDYSILITRVDSDDINSTKQINILETELENAKVKLLHVLKCFQGKYPKDRIFVDLRPCRAYTPQDIKPIMSMSV